ncbi:hypothetical protein EE612_036566, partial [Oryza sativa]
GRLCGHFSRWRVSSRSVGCGTCGLQVLSVVQVGGGGSCRASWPPTAAWLLGCTVCAGW